MSVLYIVKVGFFYLSFHWQLDFCRVGLNLLHFCVNITRERFSYEYKYNVKGNVKIVDQEVWILS